MFLSRNKSCLGLFNSLYHTHTHTYSHTLCNNLLLFKRLVILWSLPLLLPSRILMFDFYADMLNDKSLLLLRRSLRAKVVTALASIILWFLDVQDRTNCTTNSNRSETHTHTTCRLNGGGFFPCNANTVISIGKRPSVV